MARKNAAISDTELNHQVFLAVICHYSYIHEVTTFLECIYTRQHIVLLLPFINITQILYVCKEKVCKFYLRREFSVSVAVALDLNAK